MTNVEDTVNKEYIDKHEAYLLLKHKAETYMLPATKEAYEKAAILIDSLPTIEAEPDKGWVIDKLKDKLNQAFSDAVNDAQDYWNPRVAQDALQDAYSNVSCWIDEILNDGEEAQK